MWDARGCGNCEEGAIVVIEVFGTVEHLVIARNLLSEILWKRYDM